MDESASFNRATAQGIVTGGGKGQWVISAEKSPRARGEKVSEENGADRPAIG